MIVVPTTSSNNNSNNKMNASYAKTTAASSKRDAPYSSAVDTGRVEAPRRLATGAAISTKRSFSMGSLATRMVLAVVLSSCLPGMMLVEAKLGGRGRVAADLEHHANIQKAKATPLMGKEWNHYPAEDLGTRNLRSDSTQQHPKTAAGDQTTNKDNSVAMNDEVSGLDASEDIIKEKVGEIPVHSATTMERLVGGTPADPGQFPYFSKLFMCCLQFVRRILDMECSFSSSNRCDVFFLCPLTSLYYWW